MRLLFWTAAALLAFAQAGYGLLLVALRRLGAPAWSPPPPAGALPPVRRVSLIVAAHREQDVIAARVANALALDWPRAALELIVAVDGGADPGADATAARARAAGADLVLELPRVGKVRAQDAAVARASGDLLAFSDANTLWEPGALRALAAAFADPAVGYACGRVTFAAAGATNQEGAYWRYEMWLRAHESALASVTAGNGAIYAVRPQAYRAVDARVSHDLSLPFALVKDGWRAVDVPDARATERMIPTIGGEWARKRRMMAHAWPGILYAGLLDPRGYPPLYALFVAAHRGLRYASPLLHALAALATLALLRRGRVYVLAAAVQAAVLAGAAAAGRRPARPLLLARYYVATTAAIAAGLYDHLVHGTAPGWERAEDAR